MLVKNYTEDDFLRDYGVLERGGRILNAGSSEVRYGDRCFNVDIQPGDNVDLVCDLHELPDSIGTFDAIICNAVLQYCRRPDVIAAQFHRRLTPGGLLFVDAPWVQPYCPDTPDRYRFSKEALLSIFSEFEILKSGVSIRPGSALVMVGSYVAGSMTGSRYVNRVLSMLTTAVLFPLCYIRTRDEEKTAGAFYVVARKPTA